MGIADFFRPKHRHSDVRVRTEYVRALGGDDLSTLIDVAQKDTDIGLRRLAIGKIEKPEVLADLLKAETERSLRDLLESRAGELWIARACSEDADAAGEALSGIAKLGDQRALVEVVVRAAVPAIRKRAFGELRDPKALAELAKRDAPQELRTAAVARIDDGDVLRALAIDTSTKEVGLAAVAKLDDIDRLENVAQKAKHKAVRQKARKIVTEITEAQKSTLAAKHAVPDDVKRRRAERAQLLREVEAVQDTFQLVAAAATVKAAEAAWAALGPATAGDEPDDRFGKAVQRFKRRKEQHDHNARSAEELRTAARDGERERERERAARLAAEQAQAAQAAAPAPAPIPVAESDEARATREADAAARKLEADARRAEDDARKAAQAAEREARAKEDADRGAAIAASLGALIADMESLAEAKDSKGIDRLLEQATKAFGGIAKVPGEQRDGLADRYRAARGKLVTRAGELREAEDWQRWANVPKAEALIATAKEWQSEPASPDLGNRLRSLQALWKEVGPMPQRRSKELWDLFKVECDKVYEQVRGVRAVQDEAFGEVAKVKEALIAEAEALSQSSDWAVTADKLKALQTQWKSSGHMPRKQGDDLWKRFRAACDQFFERRKPLLDAQFEEQAQNLAAKQQLIARAQQVAAGAPGVGGWGKAIGEIKDLQAAWKDIGFVPRKDADAVYKTFRTACDALFAKRDAARDGEANAHRAEQDAIATEIEAVMAGPADMVARAIAVRAKASEHSAHGDKIEAMLKHLVTAHASAVAGTELDPTQLRARREKLIARVEELAPKQAATAAGGSAPLDVAAQLKQAMQKNAFGSLRFSGRDPIEVVAELRAEWREGGPILDEADREQHARFEATAARVLEAAGVSARERDGAGQRERERSDPSSREGGERDAGGGERTRRRRDRDDRSDGARPPSGLPRDAEPVDPPALRDVVATEAALPHPSSLTSIPDAAGSAVSAIGSPASDVDSMESYPVTTHDAVTRPAHLPPELAIGMDRPRARPATTPPPMEEIDTGWDDEPVASTAAPESDHSSAPSSTEMAGDGAVEGDGLDQVD